MTRHERAVGNVPVATATLVGRDRLLGQVIDLVLTNRLVTLTGVGGVGKTRLALEVGSALEDRFVDGVWMIELAAVGDPARVPDAIAAVLGIVPQGDRPVIDVVAEAVAGRQLLLVVDNCEHITVAAASAIEVIMQRSSTPTVLATSRESLWLAGEQRLSMAPLGLDGGAESDAVRLFVDRARSARIGFNVEDPRTVDAVIEICHTLDGLPLAIELAAARMESMTAIELRERLGDRFRLLAGAGHRPQRQRTLPHMVAWSYDLLEDDERAVLCAASVFLGGFEVSSLTELMDEPDEIATLARVGSLVDKSLLVAEQRGGRTRYRLLETVRQFAEDRLAAAGTLAQMRDRHASLFGREAAAQWDRWNGPGWRAASDWVGAELSNLRSALQWSVGREHFDVATDIAAHAAVLGAASNSFEPVGWAEDLLHAATACDVARLPRLYTGAGFACFIGRPAIAAASAHTAAELEKTQRYDPFEPGFSELLEALARVYSGDLATYVALAERIAQLPGAARAYGLPAYVDGLQASGRVDEAVALTEHSVSAARDVGSPFWIAYALWSAGLAHAHRDPRRALAAWDEGVEVVREHGVEFFAGFLARDAARVHAVEGDPDVALILFADAIGSFQQAGNIAQLIITVASIPPAFERLGFPEAAASLHAAITREPASVHHVPELANLGEGLAEALGPDRFAACTAIGAGLDLSGAATFARHQIELIRTERNRGRATAFPGGLSRREVEVLRLLADGLTTREIATQLFISAKTADHHIQHIYTKVGVSTRAEITRWALDRGIVIGTTRR